MSSAPDLKIYMDKRMIVKLNANREVEGVLRGYDQFCNLVLADAVAVEGDSRHPLGVIMLRGASVVRLVETM